MVFAMMCLAAALMPVLLVAYYLAQPLPESIRDKGKYRLMRCMSNLITDLGAVTQFFGITSRIAFEYKASLFFARYKRTPNPDVITVWDDKMDGVKVRIYRPKAGTKDGRGLIYIHGGGMRLNCPQTYDALISYLVLRTDAVIVAVDYRKAPEFPAPIPMEDSERAARYFFANAQDYGVETSKIGIAGDSGGGNLAAVLAQRFRDTGGAPQFKYQVLIQPRLQGLDLHLPSYQQNDYHAAKLLNRQGLARFLLPYFSKSLEHVQAVAENRHVHPSLLKKYRKHLDWRNIPEELVSKSAKPYTASNIDEVLASSLEEELQNPYNFPLMADSLQNLPPAMVVYSEADLVRDDGILYAHRLEEDGVQVERYYDKIGFHGVVLAIEPPMDCEAGLEILEEVVRFILQQG